jgi:hypothetical protein
MKPVILRLMIVSLLMITGMSLARAQSAKLAATIEVLDAGVELLRVDTANWIMLTGGSITGVGDTIRTDETGRARITFFSNGTDVELEPGTTYRINDFEGSETDYRLRVEVIVGETLQRINRLAEGTRDYSIDTPSMTLAARGTVFMVRVLPVGRAAMLVREGGVDARNPAEDGPRVVDSGFGVRADPDEPVSEAVPAATFDQIDSALDGCTATVTYTDDVSINVRQGPGREQPQIGIIAPSAIDRLFGQTETTGWYRIPFEEGFGWVQVPGTNLSLDAGCAGLRPFADDTGLEGETSATPAPEATPSG